MGVRCPSPGSSISVAAHQRVCVKLGSPPVRSEGFVCVVQGKGLGAYLCAGNDGGFLRSSYASAPVVRSVSSC